MNRLASDSARSDAAELPVRTNGHDSRSSHVSTNGSTATIGAAKADSAMVTVPHGHASAATAEPAVPESQHRLFGVNVLTNWWMVPIGCCLLAVLLIPLDLPAGRWSRSDDVPRFLKEVLDKAEPFGHGIGVTLVVFTVWALDPRCRQVIPLIIGGALAGGMSSNLMKLMVSRARPRSLDLAGVDWASTWGNWLPGVTGGSAGQSFPSAHTATAVAFALALSHAYPRGRWWFVTLAVLVGTQRVVASAHFPTDVCMGAAVGWTIGSCWVWSIRNSPLDPQRTQPMPTATTG
jgi:membrane-associated phospholipid phosphatase